ncbi:hypothetical protein BLA29_000864 [Euroglyphus maynei]|uniref:Uncharacterized protein n=1 Tax=Euroglyphus maynei TaxID=6958 RepID=A0A1Y3BKK2_EURMA|nr:hypothetical protein BLA29_000864 [Euroglyphus maynei]
MLIKILCTVIPMVFVALHLLLTIDGTIIDDCKVDGDKNLTEKRYIQLQSIELEYLRAKSEAQKLIDENREKDVQDEKLINRYEDLLRNYEQYDYMMKTDPEGCDGFIKELREYVEYFVEKVLKPRSIKEMFPN